MTVLLSRTIVPDCMQVGSAECWLLDNMHGAIAQYLLDSFLPDRTLAEALVQSGHDVIQALRLW